MKIIKIDKCCYCPYCETLKLQVEDNHPWKWKARCIKTDKIFVYFSDIPEGCPLENSNE